MSRLHATNNVQLHAAHWYIYMDNEDSKLLYLVEHNHPYE